MNMTTDEVKILVLLNIVAPENEEKSCVDISDDDRNEIYSRFKQQPKVEMSELDWEYIFSPIANEEWRNKLIDLFKYKPECE